MQPDRKNILKSIGEQCKAAREAKGITVEQVQKETHFHHNVVIAIEKGAADELLSQTYLKSYLKKYAGYLGLNIEELIREYSNSLTSAPQQKIEIKRIDRLDSAHQALAFYLPRIGFGILIALLFFGGAVFLRSGISVLRHKMSEAKASRIIAQKKRKTFAEKTPLKRKKAAVVRAKRSSGFIPVSISKSEPLRLAIDVNTPVLLMAASDGEILFTNVLRAGSMETVIAKKKITLWIKDASAVELTLNGDYLGSPGKGEIKNLEITRKGIKIVK